jgi:hypothetical protein
MAEVSIVLLTGIGLLLWSVGSFFILAGRFSKQTDYATGITVYNDKKTGREYIQAKNSSYLIPIGAEKSLVSPQEEI